MKNQINVYNIIRNKSEKYIENIAFLSCFVSSIFLLRSFTQYVMYPVTQFNEDRMYISVIGHRAVIIIYAVLIACLVIHVFIKNIQTPKDNILFFASVILTIPISLYMILAYNGEYLDDAIEFMLYINSAYISGYVMCKYHLYGMITKRIETLSIFMLPAFLVYGFLNITGTNPYYQDIYLGEVNYQHIAISVLPLILVFSINFIKYDNYKIFGFLNLKYNNMLRLLFVIFIWYCVIIPGGTRSIILGIIAFVILCVLYSLYIKENRKKSIILCVIILMLFGIQMVYPVVENSSDRVMDFVSNVSEGSLQTGTNAIAFTDEDYDILINDSLSDEAMELKNHIGNREVLFTLAIREGINNPFCGLGVKGFEYKYGMYPHNSALELISDFGIVPGVILSLGILLVVIKTIMLSKKDRDLGYVFLFILGYGVYLMSSGSLYDAVPLSFAIGLGITIIIKDNISKRKMHK